MITCVYCKKTKHESEFDNEHVIPEQLGKFQPKSLILSNIVCKECNNHFGITFEEEFSKRSFESYFSLLYGFKDRGYVFIPKSLINKTEVLFGGDNHEFWSKALPSVRLENNTLYFKPQIIIEQRTGNWIFLLEDLELERKEIKKKFLSIDKRGYSLIVNQEYDIKRTVEMLKIYGIDYKEKQTIPFPDSNKMLEKGVRITASYALDPPILRFISKIAFNFLIYCSIETGGGFKEAIFSTNFDPIREFIRTGNGGAHAIAMQKHGKWHSKIEGLDIEKTVLHYISLNSENGKVICYFSPYNRLHYRIDLGGYPYITLTPNLFGTGIWLDHTEGAYGKLYGGSEEGGLHIKATSIFSLIG